MRRQLVFTLLLFTGLAEFASASERLPHVIVILADDLGYGDPACNNPRSRLRTPHIDRIAKEGMRFSDAHAPAAWCTPTRYGLLTGRYPFRADLNWQVGPVIDAQRLTLPAMLRQHGYRTVMIGKWHLGFDVENRDRSGRHRGGPVDRGFDRFFGIPASLDIPPYYFLEGDQPVAPPLEQVAASQTPGWSPIQGAFWREGGIASGFHHRDVLPTFTERAVKEIRDHHQMANAVPLFLYVALTAPHTPWLPSAEFVGSSDVPLYGDFVQQVDATVGRILATLDETDMSRDTLLVFSSDNGPVWYEVDEQNHGHRATGVFRGMKGDAWEGGHRVPLLMRWPNHISPGSESRQLVCLTDLFATCAGIVGHSATDQAGEDSIDLSPLFTNTASGSLRNSLVVNSTADFFMVRSGDWKLIPFLGSGGFSVPRHVLEIPPGEPPGQLYNLREDPAETKNRYADSPQKVAELTALLDDIRRRGRLRSPAE